MKVLPAGYVQLGAVRGDTDATEGERPVLRVRHRRSFAIGVLEITVGQYKAFLAQSGHRAPACASFAAADAADPVDCVSYRDARAYVQWLSERTFKRYRLPSASEWEYAARGGNGAVWPTGARLDVEPASAVAGASRRRPAGSFEANSFGLHDMAGGVAEIVRDCWTPTLAGVPTDGTATITRACTERTLKDGAWSGPAKARRASARRPIAIDAAQPGVGFRVVREMR